MATALSSLRLQARRRADMENSLFVGDAELTQWVNEGYKELYDLLTSKYQDYFVAEPDEFEITSGNTYALPSDFYKLIGVDISLGGQWCEVEPFDFNRRNRSGAQVISHRGGVFTGVEYRILGNKLHFTPDDAATGTYRLWYVPSCTALSDDDDELDVTCDRWAEFVVVSAAIKCLAKEESDTSVLERELARLTQRIEAAAANRDVGRPGRIQDVRRDWDEVF